MTFYSTKPEKELTAQEFAQIVENKEIIISNHALDHLSSAQRGSFEENQLIGPIEKEKPRKVYLQLNKRYAVYFRKKEGFRKIILSVEKNRVVIISFMDVDELPKIQK